MKTNFRRLIALVPTIGILWIGLFQSLEVARAAEVNLLAFGDWGCGSSNQIAVAKTMADYVRGAADKKFDAALLLGDNFYTVITDTESPFWGLWFEKMYDPAVLKMPFYALLGNHDYAATGVTSRAELAYPAAHPESRWKMPGKFYRVDFPAATPLVSVLMMDGYVQGQENDSQAKWLTGELTKKDRPRWMICCAHQPLFSNSEHGDVPVVQKKFGAALEKYRVDFYLAGHDHNLQHIQPATNFTSHIVSGGGGNTVYPMFRDDRGPFTCSTNGFVHLTLTPERATVRFISMSGKTLDVFERTPDGKVEVKETTGIQKAVPRPVKKPKDKKDE